MMPILLIGLGNPILGDDGIGWKVVEEVESRILPESQPIIEIDYLSLGGLALMERLTGYKQAIIVDAILSGNNPSGTVSVHNLAELPDHSNGHTASSHDTSLQTAIKMAQELGEKLPENIIVVGIEAKNVYDFTDTFTPQVEAAIPEAVEIVFSILSQEVKS